MVKSREGSKCHLLKSGFHISKPGEPDPQRDPDSPTRFYPSPLRRPYPLHLGSLCASHMDRERKLRGEQFPYRPQSNFCFLQSRATSGVTSGPPQACEQPATPRAGPAGTREPGSDCLSAGGAPLARPARPVHRARGSALPAAAFPAAQSEGASGEGRAVPARSERKGDSSRQTWPAFCDPVSS